jgi:hypothetical protein
MADEVKLPTMEEVAKLPRGAQAAFAARCARRAAPLFVKYWPGGTYTPVVKVMSAIAIAEQYAAARIDADAARTAADGARIAAVAARTYAASKYPSAATAYRAASVADAAIAAAEVNATSAAIAAADAGVPAALVRSDFTKLLKLAIRERWTDHTPVSPEVFDPIEPDATEPKQPVEPLISVSFCGGHFSPEDVELVLRYLSTLDREQGGAGLKVLKGRQLQPAPVAVTP